MVLGWKGMLEALKTLLVMLKFWPDTLGNCTTSSCQDEVYGALLRNSVCLPPEVGATLSVKISSSVKNRMAPLTPGGSTTSVQIWFCSQHK